MCVGILFLVQSLVRVCFQDLEADGLHQTIKCLHKKPDLYGNMLII